MDYLQIAFAFALPLASVAGAGTLEADPAIYAQAFDSTCRQGFPDADAIVRNATAHGWTERSIRVVASTDAVPVHLPRMLGKDGLMLFVSTDASGPFRTVCQITGAAGTRLSGREVAAAVTPRLNVGEPTPGTGNYKKDDYSLWTIAPGITVQAGVSVYQGKVRTISMSMREARVAGAAPIDPPKPAKSDDIPMVAIGLPFAPEAPQPLAQTHPLFRDVAVGEIEGLPPTVKSSALNWIAAAKRSTINAALVETFRRMNLLATPATAARKKLIVTWNGNRTPFHIGASNSSSVTMHYRLVRVDSGQVLFDRDVTTSARGGGADASMRDNGIVRAAIAANFASAANCLDRAAFGTAPADCALTPLFSISIVRTQ